MTQYVIVVGGGRMFYLSLAEYLWKLMRFAVSGLSAAHTLYLAGGNVLVLDKQGEFSCSTNVVIARSLSRCLGFFGGNSTKATSGINAALTRTQVDAKIQDSVKQFYEDTMKSARDKARPELIKVLTYRSSAAVEWLQDVFNLDLTLVSRLGYVCVICVILHFVLTPEVVILSQELIVDTTQSFLGWL